MIKEEKERVVTFIVLMMKIVIGLCIVFGILMILGVKI